jgi:hypothetical protein
MLIGVPSVVRLRRILPVPARSGGGRLTERTPAVQPRRRERVKVPLSGPPAPPNSTNADATALMRRTAYALGPREAGVDLQAASELLDGARRFKVAIHFLIHLRRKTDARNLSR